jgi:hypothetical protein
MMKSVGLTVLLVAVFVIALSALFHVPFVFGLLIVFAWPVLGMMITADDYAKGGWENPDGTAKQPWPRFLLFVALTAGVCTLIVLFPQIRTYGF